MLNEEIAAFAAESGKAAEPRSIAVLLYAEYVEVSTAARYQTLGGERGGAFRNPESVRNMAKKFRTIQASANKQCLVD